MAKHAYLGTHLSNLIPALGYGILQFRNVMIKLCHLKLIVTSINRTILLAINAALLPVVGERIQGAARGRILRGEIHASSLRYGLHKNDLVKVRPENGYLLPFFFFNSSR